MGCFLSTESEANPGERSLTPAAHPVAAIQVFGYEQVVSSIQVGDCLEAVENVFKMLAEGKVEVPMPMHIGVEAVGSAGPGDCHIKGGYVLGNETFTVKMATVSFYKNGDRGLPPGSGIFCVMSAVTGMPLAVFQENRYLTDLRTGAAAAIAFKHLTKKGVEPPAVAFLGIGKIGEVIARACAAVGTFHGYAYARTPGKAQAFCDQMSATLNLKFTACATAEEACGQADCIMTSTPGKSTVLELGWLRPHCTIVATGSDQPTKQEIPVDVIAKAKYIPDLVKQTSKVGELRSALDAGVVTANHVHGELGEVLLGRKAGRVGDELIVVDLTGTGAQDAAVGQVAWNKLGNALSA